MSQLVAVTTGGIRWHVLPEYRDWLFGPQGFRLDDWLRSGRAEIVKHGPHRTVYRVALPGLEFYLKHYRLLDLRAWLRGFMRPPKARWEFQQTTGVAARQIPTFVPLAVGEQGHGVLPGESFLITLSLDGTEPLTRFVETTLPLLEAKRQARVRQRLAVKLGQLIGRMHNAGVIHKDLHAGNVLIHLAATDQPTLYLIDLYAVKLGRPLGWRASRANLVMLNRWFVLKASGADRQRFWRAYCRTRSREQWAGSSGQGIAQNKREKSWPYSSQLTAHCLLPTEMARDVEQRTWISNWVFWRNRDRRCLATNRYYQRWRRRSGSTAFQGHAVRDLDRTVLDTLLDDPDESFRRPGVKLLKNGPSSTVAEFDLPVNGTVRRVIYKRFRVTNWSDPWVAWVRRSPALRSWVQGHGLRERGLPTARPLAVWHRRRRGLYYEGYLLTEKIPHAVDLHGWLARLDPMEPGQRRAMLRQRIDHVARLVRELHRRQLSHRDLKAANILVPEPGQLVPAFGCWLIDLVGVVRCRKLKRARRVQNLARLNASFHQSPALTRTDRLRFLRIYLAWGLEGRHRWKRWWREVEQATVAKIDRNARNGRPLC